MSRSHPLGQKGSSLQTRNNLHKSMECFWCLGNQSYWGDGAENARQCREVSCPVDGGEPSRTSGEHEAQLIYSPAFFLCLPQPACLHAMISL